ncbi:unnamed protein product [Symbiodinium sp. CCMP2592]|nr:unnamed protein product [Symbiodinium sp. CCMP2592]
MGEMPAIEDEDKRHEYGDDEEHASENGHRHYGDYHDTGGHGVYSSDGKRDDADAHVDFGVHLVVDGRGNDDKDYGFESDYAMQYEPEELPQEEGLDNFSFSATRLPAFGAPEAAEAEASQRPEPAPVSGDDELLEAKALVIEADQELEDLRVQVAAFLAQLPLGRQRVFEGFPHAQDVFLNT